MKQSSLLIIIIYFLTYNSIFVSNGYSRKDKKTNNKIKFQVYNHIANIELKTLLPKYGYGYFRPIRINYVHITDKVIPNFLSEYSDEKFAIFKKLIIDPVDTFFKNSIKLYPLYDFPEKMIYSRIGENGNMVNFDIGKFIRGYVLISFI